MDETPTVVFHTDVVNELRVNELILRRESMKRYILSRECKERWYCLCLIFIAFFIGGLIIVPVYLLIESPNQIRLDHIKGGVEQLDSYVNQYVITRQVNGTCILSDVYRYEYLNALYDSKKNYFYYDERYPQDTLTTDDNYVNNIREQRNLGIALMCFGRLICVCFLISFYLLKN